LNVKAPISHSKDPGLLKAPQALLRAAEKARQLAKQTGAICRAPSSIKIICKNREQMSASQENWDNVRCFLPNQIATAANPDF